MIVLDRKLTLTSEDTMRHKSCNFTVPSSAGGLKIYYEYSPKIYENKEDSLRIIKDCYARYGAEITDPESELPLNNLITISIDSPSGRVGAAHRHLNKAEYFISEKEASPGFIPVPIEEGEWTLILSAHCILSDKVNISVRVETYD